MNGTAEHPTHGPCSPLCWARRLVLHQQRSSSCETGIDRAALSGQTALPSGGVSVSGPETLPSSFLWALRAAARAMINVYSIIEPGPWFEWSFALAVSYWRLAAVQIGSHPKKNSASHALALGFSAALVVGQQS